MVGRVTSLDKSRNEFGALWSEVARGERKAHQRHVKAFREALDAWKMFDDARQENKPAREQGQLRRHAIELTEKALG